MNDFVSNLLHRHQSTCDVVMPRPISRFETEGIDPGGSSEKAATQMDFQEKTLLRSPRNPIFDTKQNETSRRSGPSVPPKPSDMQLTQPANLSPEKREKRDPQFHHIERTDSETREIRKTKAAALTNVSASPRAQPEPQTMGLRKTEPISIGQPRTVGLSAESEPVQHVIKILERLHEHRTDFPTEQAPRDAKASRQTVHIEEPEPIEKRPSKAQPQSDPANIGAHAKNFKTLPSEPHDAEEPVREDKNLKSDRLMPPFWAYQLAAQLKSQEMEVTTAIQNEPVINVTIGRVEVRAVPSEKSQPRPGRKKFSGVMSLDQYLKQREQAGSI